MHAKLTAFLTAMLAIPALGYCDGPAAKSKFDTKFISKDFVAAIVGHPQRALNGPVLKALLAEVEKSGGKEVSEEPFLETIKELGLDLRNMKQVVILLDKNSIGSSEFFLFRPRMHEHDHGMPPPGGFDRPPGGDGADDGAAPADKDPAADPNQVVAIAEDDEDEEDRDVAQPRRPLPPPGVPGEDTEEDPGDDGRGFGRRPRRQSGPAMIFRLTKPMDRKAVMKALSINTWETQVERTADGRIKGRRRVRRKAPPTKTIYKDFVYYINHRTAFYIADDRTLVTAPEDVLKKMLTAKNVRSPLINRLQALGTRPDGMIVVDFQALAPMFATMPMQMLPRDVVKLFGHATKIKTLTAIADVTGKPSASIILETTDAKTATEVGTLIDKRLLPLGKAFWELQRPYIVRYERDPSTKLMVELFDGIIQGASATREGKNVTVTTAGPKNLVALTKRFGRAVGAEVKRSKRKNNLQQIGIAFHNYHETHRRFPAHGADAAGKPGLSWRVHLLPYLDEAELYRQFKLDEAWDSPHNKKLIAKMPKIFRTPGVKAAEKTAIHVFTGPNGPFGGKFGPRFRDVTDGTSNTFLTVEAGPDKADVWTKPGGLKFDLKTDPRKLLGKIDPETGFLAGMMDGSVHVITKETTAKTLGRLIQHNDGKPIGAFGNRRRGFNGRDVEGIPMEEPGFAPPGNPAGAADPDDADEVPAQIERKEKEDEDR